MGNSASKDKKSAHPGEIACVFSVVEPTDSYR
jgi:hypothetical protein